MSTVASSGATISYDVHGAADAPALLFINSIGTARALWDRQRRVFESSHRVIQYDARGHGQSSVPPGPYTIAQLAQDAVAILDAERIASADVCGISLGGITALWLGVHAPERVRSLVLANTGARIGTIESWTARITLVYDGGMKAVADVAIPMWFTEEYRQREAATVQQFRAMVESCPVEGYLGCAAALRDEDLRDAVASVRCAVLSIAGASDRATAPELLHFVQKQLPRSRLVTLPCAHLSNVEQAAAFNAALSTFLAAQAA
jgi:3-oxoadipate enol-lactonase